MDSLDKNQELVGALDTLLDETADQSNYTPPTPRLQLLLTTNSVSLQDEDSYDLRAGGMGTIASVDRDEVIFSQELDPKHREVTQAEEELVCLENDPDSTVRVASQHTYRRVDDAQTVTWIDHHDDDSATLFEAVPAITGRLDDVSEHSEQIFDTVDDLYGRLSGMDRFDGPKSDANTLKRELDEHLTTL